VRSTLALLVVMTVLCGLGGCALIGLPNPDDLTFASVSVIYSKDRTDDTWPLRVPGSPINEKLLRIDFTTKFDLFYAASGRHYNIWNRMDFCHPETNVYNSGVSWHPGVYWNGIDVTDTDAYLKQPEVLKAYGSTTMRTFYAYLSASHYRFPNTPHFFGEPPPLLYNLDDRPEDVCLRVSGGKMLGSSFQSNIVFIPRAAIANALATAR
jgi:hypothetical protein